MKTPALALILASAASLLTASCTSAQPRSSGTTYASSMGDAAAPATPNYRLATYSPTARPPATLPQTVPAYTPPATPLPFVGPSNMSTSAPSIRAESYIIVNPRTGAVLAARNADTVRGVASTQKLLTALIVAETGNLDKQVRVAASDVAVEPSKLGVKPGEVYTRRELLIAFLVKSSNDVANVLARDNAGSVSAFAAKMTSKARELGATNSRFANPHGLTAKGQYSTARDMARIALAAYNNPVIRDAVRREHHTFRFASGRTTRLDNTNDLLGRMAECDGMKTGYTAPAGRCLVSSAQSGGHRVILVQLGTRTTWIWNDGEAMMRWGLARS